MTSVSIMLHISGYLLYAMIAVTVVDKLSMATS